VRPLAPLVRCPTMVLHAEGDQIVPVALGRDLAAASGLGVELSGTVESGGYPRTVDHWRVQTGSRTYFKINRRTRNGHVWRTALAGRHQGGILRDPLTAVSNSVSVKDACAGCASVSQRRERAPPARAAQIRCR